MVVRTSGLRVAHWTRARSALMIIGVAFALVAGGCTAPGLAVPSGGVPDPALPTPVSYPWYTATSCAPTGECVAVGNTSARWDGTRWAVTRPPWYAQPRTSPLEIPYMPLLPWGRQADVSCVSVTWCMAVAYEGHLPLGAFVGDGRTWLPVPISAGVTPRHVSCVSAQFCLARGVVTPAEQPDSSLVDPDPVTLRWDGLTWTDISSPVGPGDTRQLSCASATWCLAVGTDRSVRGQPAGFAERWDGTAWTPEDLGERAVLAGLTGVSCAAVGQCRAVGDTHAGSGPVPVLTRTTAGWSVTGGPAAATRLTGIDCPSTTECVTVGSSGEGAGELFLARLSAAGWTTVPAGGAARSVRATALACATGEHCVAVGSGSLLSYRGAEVGVNEGVPALPGPPVSRLTDVSCIDTTTPTGPGRPYCLAVGLAWPFEQGRTITAVGDGTTWQLSVYPDHTDPLAYDGGRPHLQSVSCLTPTLCLAAGDEWDVSGHDMVSLVYRWDGGAWARQHDPVLTGLGASPQISCGGDGCVAAAGQSFTPYGEPIPGTGGVAVGVRDGDGLSWRKVEGAGPELGNLERFSCASTSRCVGIGAGVVVWDGQQAAIVDPAVVSPLGYPRDVTCAPDGSCVVVGIEGGAFHLDGETWTHRPAPAATWLMAVSCTARDNCTAFANAGADPLMSLFAPPAPVLAGWDGRAWVERAGVSPKLRATWLDVDAFSCVTAWCMSVGGTGPYSFDADPAASSPAAERLPR